MWLRILVRPAFSWKNFCASRPLRFSYGESNLHRFSGILKKTDRKICKNKKLKNTFLKIILKKSKNRKNRKIENWKKVTWFQLEIFEFLDFRYSKIFNWNQVTFFDFSIFGFHFFWFFSTSDRSQKISTEAIFKILVPGKSWDSPPQKHLEYI